MENFRVKNQTKVLEIKSLFSQTVARKGKPKKKQKGWCSDNETGGGDGKAER
jgi:hypothetical protein